MSQGSLISNDLDDMSEDDALAVFWDLRRHFGWAGTIWIRSDVESAVGREITEAEWEAVQSAHTWRKMADILSEDGEFAVREAINDAGITCVEDEEG